MSRVSQQAIKDLQKKHDPLTEAEALWVLSQDEGSEDELVTEVKAMRVGPYRDLEDVVPEDEGDEEPEDEVPPAPWTNERIATVNAGELVTYVKDNPDEAQRVAQIEGSREGGPRKTVLDAVESVVDIEDDGEGGES